MADLPSKTQLDKLGDRLRAGSRNEADLRELDEYRRSFRPAYDWAIGTLQDVRIEKTGRPAKTPGAIIEKLRRQPIRLTQIQDIAGYRLVCNDAPDQDLIVSVIASRFPKHQIDDRRKKPSHGYRAVHVIVTAEGGKFVEIQVRTRAQHRWAELSEKLSDLYDPAIKYGGGPVLAQEGLASYSETVRHCEELERQHHDMRHRAYELGLLTADAANAAEHERLTKVADELAVSVRDQQAFIAQSLRDIEAFLLRAVGDSQEEEKSDDLPN